MFKGLAFAVVLSLGSLGGVAADDKPGADWMSREKVMEKLKAAGYTDVTELEADDGHWEGEGVKNGKRMDFHVDPKTGEFTKEEADR